MLGQVRPGVAPGRVDGGALQPPRKHRLGLGRLEVVDQIMQAQHTTRAQHPGDAVQRDRLPEVGQLMPALRVYTASAGGPARW